MDVWCILAKGPSSSNSQNPTFTYLELCSAFGANPNSDLAERYLSTLPYLTEKHLNKKLRDFHEEWHNSQGIFLSRAEKCFGKLPELRVTAFLTNNQRCPYSIDKSWFFVPLRRDYVFDTVMHELWHFFTWYCIGNASSLGVSDGDYNSFKEALTVLINIEMPDLLPSGCIDKGYPQHQELREWITENWTKTTSIQALFELWRNQNPPLERGFVGQKL